MITTKKCGVCNEEKDINDFSTDKGRKDGKRKDCKICNRIRQNKRYANSATVRANQKEIHRKRRIRFSNFIYNYYKTHPCVDCGNSDPRVLQLDHVRGAKSYNVARMSHCSMAKIEAEIAKCEVRCANCHSIKTAEQQGWYRNVINFTNNTPVIISE
jgi:hypothetical protein